MEFDRPPAIDQNVRVRRSILLAIAVSLLWAASVRIGGVPTGDNTEMSGVESALLVGAPQPPSDTDDGWRAPYQSTVPVGESFWKSPQFHAELAAAPTPRFFDPVPVSTSPDLPATSTPHFLRHTPLLI